MSQRQARHLLTHNRGGYMGNEEKLLQQKMSEDMSEEDKQMLEW